MIWEKTKLHTADRGAEHIVNEKEDHLERSWGTELCGVGVFCRCGLSHVLQDEDVVQIVKKKVSSSEDGRGRFKTKSDQPKRISDREKKPALKT